LKISTVLDNQSGAYVTRRIFRLENFNLGRNFNPNGTRFFSLESDGSTISNEDSRSLSTTNSSDHFQYGPKWATTNNKVKMHLFVKRVSKFMNSEVFPPICFKYGHSKVDHRV
jgi:hypothetical protein